MWEIVTRRTPFSGTGFEFDGQVENAVLNGTRPAIPADTHEDLGILIGQCWQEKPKSRPQFRDIVPRLKSLVSELQQDRASIGTDFNSETDQINQLNSLAFCGPMDHCIGEIELCQL